MRAICSVRQVSGNPERAERPVPLVTTLLTAIVIWMSAQGATRAQITGPAGLVVDQNLAAITRDTENPKVTTITENIDSEAVAPTVHIADQGNEMTITMIWNRTAIIVTDIVEAEAQIGEVIVAQIEDQTANIALVTIIMTIIGVTIPV